MIITINNNNHHSGFGGFIAQTIVLTLAAILAAYCLPGVHIDTIWTAIITSVVIALLNRFLKPILVLLTLPLAALSLGLFLFVINAAIIMIASAIVPSFHVDNFGYALLFSLLLTLFNFLLELPNSISKHRHDKNSDSENVHFVPYEEVSESDDDGSFTPCEEIKEDEHPE